MMQCKSKDIKMGDIEGQLFWLLRTIWEDDRKLFMLRLPILVNEVQRLLNAEPKAKAMMNERTNDIVETWQSSVNACGSWTTTTHGP